MKWLVLYYSKYDRYTRCFQAFKSKEEAISYKDKVLFDYNIIGIVELTEPKRQRTSKECRCMCKHGSESSNTKHFNVPWMLSIPYQLSNRRPKIIRNSS